MNEVIEKFVVAKDKLMSEKHLRQPRSKALQTVEKKVKEAIDSRYIYLNKLLNELDKACFQHDKLINVLGIFLEEQLLIKYYIIKYLILLKIQNMMDISVELLHFL